MLLKISCTQISLSIFTLEIIYLYILLANTISPATTYIMGCHYEGANANARDRM